jgi:ketopantoate hydroxymethyltransferase
MLTAYDFPSALVADHAGMDMVLVGDSLAMVSMGLEDTSEVTIEEMIMCCRSVARAIQSSFTVCPLTSPCTIAHADPSLLRSETSQWAAMKSLPSRPSHRPSDS